MKNNWLWIMILLLWGMTASCSKSEEEEMSEHASFTSSVAFDLNLGPGQPDGLQREVDSLPKGKGYKIGQNFENWISPGTLKILIYLSVAEGLIPIGRVEQLEYISGEEQPAEYRFRGRSSVPLEAGRRYRFMVSANTSAAVSPGEGPAYSLSDIHYPEGALPMWGTTTHEVDYRPVQQLPPVGLLRASARVEVRLSQEMWRQGYRLSKGTVFPVSVSGYAFPKSWQVAAFTSDLQPAGIFHPLLSNIFSRHYEFFPAGTDSAALVTYLPEYTNVGNSSPAKISLTVRKGTLEQEYAGAIAFQKYTEGVPVAGTHYDIVRNHAYEFTISKVLIGHALSIESKVAPWEIHEETWDYTDHVSVRSEGKMQWVKGTYERIDPESGSVVMIPGAALACTFQIDTPEEAQWHASFIPVSGESDAFRFVSHAIDDGRNATGKVGEWTTLKIRSVKPVSGENNVALLRLVVVTKGGLTIWVKNLLPDEFQNLTEYTLVQPQ